jgi:hypothetical protein
LKKNDEIRKGFKIKYKMERISEFQVLRLHSDKRKRALIKQTGKERIVRSYKLTRMCELENKSLGFV